MNQIEKTAHALAVQTVYVAEMKKQAVSPGLESVLTSGALGALAGGAGTGVISSLAGRRREDYLRDILLGALVGGAGGAAIPYTQQLLTEPKTTAIASPTITDVISQPTTSVRKFTATQPKRTAAVAGAGVLGERLSRWAEMQKSLAPELQQYAQKFREGLMAPKPALKPGVAPSKPVSFKERMRMVRRMPGLGRTRGLGARPTLKSLKGGGLAALAALLLGLGANK